MKEDIYIPFPSPPTLPKIMVPVLFHIVQGLKRNGVVWTHLALDGTNQRDVLNAVMKFRVPKIREIDYLRTTATEWKPNYS
jgi:hypothetical protein